MARITIQKADAPDWGYEAVCEGALFVNDEDGHSILVSATGTPEKYWLVDLLGGPHPDRSKAGAGHSSATCASAAMWLREAGYRPLAPDETVVLSPDRFLGGR